MRGTGVMTALVLTVVLLTGNVMPSPAQSQKTGSSAKGGKTVLRGGVGATARMGGTVSSSPLGYETRSGFGKSTITKVVAGSEAWARGLKEGDTVVAEQKNGNTTAVTIERDGRRYQANLTSVAVDSSSVPMKIPPLAGGAALTRQLTTISNHNVYLIIDKSGSMATRDCPGSVSRWKWCAGETHNLTAATASCGCLKDGITIAVFSDAYYVYNNATVGRIAEIFENNQPDGTTNTGDALQSQIDDYFARKAITGAATRPAVIAVVTDGEPNKPDQVRQVIIDATKRMTDPNELSITFLQVGAAPFGAALLRELDNNLVYEGADFDIVDTKSFAELDKLGLVGAIAEAITALRTPSQTRARSTRTATSVDPQPQYRRAGNNSRVVRPATQYRASPGRATSSPGDDLRRAEQERRDIEKRLLEN